VFKIVEKGVTQSGMAVEIPSEAGGSKRTDFCCHSMVSIAKTSGIVSVNYPFDVLIDLDANDVDHSIVIAVQVLRRGDGGSMEPYAYGRL